MNISAGNVPIFNGAQFIYSSTHEIAYKIINFIINSTGTRDFFEKEIKARVLEPGKKWATGSIRLRVIVEFIPDEPENNGIPNKVASSLENFRSKNL